MQEVELADRKIDVKIEIDGDIPEILGDRGQIKQVFFNLIKNAMEAMTGKGQLKILARSDSEHVYLQFVDNGSGISQTDMSKIFDAYYTTKENGHGLGMMIVQRIMRDHGGHIAVESQSDVGTVITLQFPQQHIRTRMLESGE